jgi:ubiquinone/menaquinone biosynthesis C-methylase UbiE
MSVSPRSDSDAAFRQVWGAEKYEKNARFVSDMTGDVVGWLAPKPGERILDLGCGDGALTEKLVQACAIVTGADSSEALLAAARKRGLDVHFKDGQALDYGPEFDAVFSNAALHWMTRAEDVVKGVARALKQGGRFVAEFGGHGNIAAIVTALRATAIRHGKDPALAAGWFYPTPAEYRALLEANGFAVERIGLFPRPTPLPTGLRGWLATFRESFFDQWPQAQREQIISEIESLLAPALRDQTGNWTADYVRLRVAAVRG